MSRLPPALKQLPLLLFLEPQLFFLNLNLFSIVHFTILRDDAAEPSCRNSLLTFSSPESAVSSAIRIWSPYILFSIRQNPHLDPIAYLIPVEDLYLLAFWVSLDRNRSQFWLLSEFQHISRGHRRCCPTVGRKRGYDPTTSNALFKINSPLLPGFPSWQEFV